MPAIHLSVLYIGSKSEKVLDTCFDETISLSRINGVLLDEIDLPKKLGRPRNIHLGDQDFSAEYVVCLDFYINDILLSDEFLLVPQLVEDVVMGGATIRKWRIKLNFDDNSVYVDPKVARHQLI